MTIIPTPWLQVQVVRELAQMAFNTTVLEKGRSFRSCLGGGKRVLCILTPGRLPLSLRTWAVPPSESKVYARKTQTEPQLGERTQPDVTLFFS